MFLPLQTCVFVQSASQSRCINIPELVTPWFGMLMFLFFDCSSTKQKSTSSCRVNIPKLAMNHCSMISAILILVGGSSHLVSKWLVTGVSSPTFIFIFKFEKPSFCWTSCQRAGNEARDRRQRRNHGGDSESQPQAGKGPETWKMFGLFAAIGVEVRHLVKKREKTHRTF